MQLFNYRKVCLPYKLTRQAALLPYAPHKRLVLSTCVTLAYLVSVKSPELYEYELKRLEEPPAAISTYCHLLRKLTPGPVKRLA